MANDWIGSLPRNSNDPGITEMQAEGDSRFLNAMGEMRDRHSCVLECRAGNNATKEKHGSRVVASVDIKVSSDFV